MRRRFFASADDRCLDELVAAACGSRDSGFRSRKIGEVMARLRGIREEASQLVQCSGRYLWQVALKEQVIHGRVFRNFEKMRVTMSPFKERCNLHWRFE